MLTIRKPLTLIGAVLVFLGTVLPVLKVKVIFTWASWSLYKTDIRLFLISNALLGMIVLTSYIQQTKAYKLLTRLMLGWIVLMAVAVYVKSNNYFGVNVADKLLGKAISFEYGWLVLLAGALALVFSVKKQNLTV